MGEFIRRLGAFPSPWDYRHYRVSRATLAQTESLPKEYTELLNYAPTDDWPDQGDVGSCVGWDGSIVMEITNTLLKAYATRTGKKDLLSYIHTDLSAGWLYHWSRIHAGVPDWQEGSTNLGLMKALNKNGTATEASVPTDTKAPWDGITTNEEIEQEALGFAVDSYWFVNSNPNDVKAAIYGLTHEAPYKMPDGSAGKIPLASAFPVYSSFEENENGIVPMPKLGDSLLGGHSSCILGWKILDDAEYFVSFNSWGKERGDNGLYYLPIDYPFYAGDWCLIHNGPPIQEPDPGSSPCSVGRGVANTLSWLAGRRGRFYYANPRS